MFLIMAVTLYTSRKVLQVLGVEDFGIYNVVGGIVAMMGILNGAMASSMQRYFSFELGENNDEKLHKIFCISMTIYMLLCVIFVILAETIGVWFLNTQLMIPEEKMTAANWVFQFSILAVIAKLLSNPYHAMIIAHEKMNVFAYISIAEVFINLSVVFLLLLTSYNKLIIYSALLFLSACVITTINRKYCISHYEECKFKFIKDISLFKELLGYSGWNLFGSVANIVKGQGLNVLLGMFFTPAVNAARGIAYQVNAAVTQFFSNFYTAVRPQITKYYAEGDMNNMFKLVFQSSKYSFYLILLISLPLIIETPFFINLWLGQLPEYVIPFTRLIILITAIDAMANPLMTTAHATGKIALYQSLVGTTIILNIPISYILLTLKFPPTSVFVVSLCISIFCLFLRLWIVKRLVAFPVWDYVKSVLLRSLVVSCCAAIAPILCAYMLGNSLASDIMVSCICIISSVAFIVAIGMDKQERKTCKNLITSKLGKR